MTTIMEKSTETANPFVDNASLWTDLEGLKGDQVETTPPQENNEAKSSVVELPETRVGNAFRRLARRIDAFAAFASEKKEIITNTTRETFATIGRGARTAAERSISGARTAVEFSTGVAVAGVEAVNQGIEAIGQSYMTGTEEVGKIVDKVGAAVDQKRTTRAMRKAERIEQLRVQKLEREAAKQAALEQQENARQEAARQAEIDRQAEMARRREEAEQKAQAAAERKAKRHAKWDAMKYRAMKSFLGVKEAVKSGAGSAKEFADNRAEAAQDLVARHRDAGRAAIDAYRSTVNKEEEHPIEYNI